MSNGMTVRTGFELPESLRQSRQYGLVDADSRFHIFKASSFPPAFECGLRSYLELVDFYPIGSVCANCIHIVALEDVADQLVQRQQTVHERVPCPKCGAPVGERCRSMPRGYRPLDAGQRGRTLKSSHRWRLTADGIHLR